MNYLYHMFPKNMEGNILMPLNELKKKYPNIYHEQIKKYLGRESLLDRKIPILNCLWNDVLHFTAVSPNNLKKALTESGKPTNTKTKWLKVNSKNLNKENIIVYLYPEKVGERFKEKYYIKLNDSDFENYSKIPQTTKQYFKETYDKGEKPLLFHLIPHILYKGEINIEDCEIIEI